MPTPIGEIFNNMEYGPALESSEEALKWIEEHSDNGHFGLYIDGGWLARPDNERIDTFNPATGTKLASITQAGINDVGLAVTAAQAASDSWTGIGPHGRARYLYAIARQIQKQSRLLAVLETLDNGKPIRESRDIDIPLVIRHFYHHAGWAQVMESEFPGYGPIGTVCQIIPWNFPLLMLAWKVAPALAMGNRVVLKPAENTSLTTLAFAHICDEVGLPQGVVNIVTGDGRVGEQIVNNQRGLKIAFTGSTEVGRAIRRVTAGTGAKLTLELGGKSPFIVFDDADIDGAVEGLVDAIWFNQGQVCCAGSRLLVQESIAEKLLDKIKMRMARLRVGNPMDKTVDMGAIVSDVQKRRIEALVATVEDQGGTVWRAADSCPAEGCFYPPTLITDVSPAATVVQEEIFGPVLIAMTFRTPAEAVELANNTRYGLAASVWSENINLAMDVAPKIKAGTVWINSTNLFDAGSGFGGYRESGFGREGGREGLWEYCRPTKNAVRRSSEYQYEPHFESEKAKRIEIRPKRTTPGLDRTAKLYIGGKQARPDSGYSLKISSPSGNFVGHVGEGNRKDIRNAVEAARAAGSWGTASTHLRAQILYYIAENLEARAEEFSRRIVQQTDRKTEDADAEVRLSIERIFTYAALADKNEGAVHPTPSRCITLAVPEPLGVIGIGCPFACPLLGFVSTVIPAIAMGNTVVAVPSEPHPLSATDLYQVFDTSDLPAGVVNIVTGCRDLLMETLAGHDDVSSVWYWGTQQTARRIEELSAENMKRTWTDHTYDDAWYDNSRFEIGRMLRESTQVKNIWVPYGE